MILPLHPAFGETYCRTLSASCAAATRHHHHTRQFISLQSDFGVATDGDTDYQL